MVKKLQLGITVGVLALVSINANSELVGRLPATQGGTDYQAYYDTDADLTWLADANAAGTAMNWVDANAWAAGLDVDGVTGWRLADTIQPDASCDLQSGDISRGFNCTGSEMGNLFYNVLGTSAGSLPNTGPFSNVQSFFYWTATEYASDPDLAWLFNTNGGFQDRHIKPHAHFAWAVQSGDVAPP